MNPTIILNRIILKVSIRSSNPLKHKSKLKIIIFGAQQIESSLIFFFEYMNLQSHLNFGLLRNVTLSNKLESKYN